MSKQSAFWDSSALVPLSVERQPIQVAAYAERLGEDTPSRCQAPPGRHPDAIDWLAFLLNPGKRRLRSFNRSRVECIDHLLAGFRQEGAQVDSNPMDSVDPASQDLI
jgi:hypothetical protein